MFVKKKTQLKGDPDAPVPRPHLLLVSLLRYTTLADLMSLMTEGGRRPDTDTAYTPFLKRPVKGKGKKHRLRPEVPLPWPILSCECRTEQQALTYPLPLCNPAVVRLGQAHHALEIGGGAVVHVLPVVPQPQKGLAVVAAVVLELLERLESETTV